MKKSLLFFATLLILFAGISCTKNEPTLNSEVDTTILYSNSFESSADTIGWQGSACFVELIEDANMAGEEQSITVSCGCIGPYFYYEIDAVEEDSYAVISCEGKASGMGGSLSLHSPEGMINIPISGQNSTWQHYESTDTLFCAAGESFKVYLSAGGIKSGEIIIDHLEVRVIE